VTSNYQRNVYARATAEQLLQLPVSFCVCLPLPQPPALSQRQSVNPSTHPTNQLNRPHPTTKTHNPQVDLTFANHPALRPLPRAVYALLRSPLLSPAAQSHADLTTYLHHLWGSLPAPELSRAIYPALSAWADCETLIAGGLDLSKASLDAYSGQGGGGGGGGGEIGPGAAAGAEGSAAAAAGRPATIWVLDAYILILVLYLPGQGGVEGGGEAGGEQQQQQQQWSPPADSLLWRTITKTRQVRGCHCAFVRGDFEGQNLTVLLCRSTPSWDLPPPPPSRPVPTPTPPPLVPPPP